MVRYSASKRANAVKSEHQRYIYCCNTFLFNSIRSGGCPGSSGQTLNLAGKSRANPQPDGFDSHSDQRQTIFLEHPEKAAITASDLRRPQHKKPSLYTWPSLILTPLGLSFCIFALRTFGLCRSTAKAFSSGELFGRSMLIGSESGARKRSTGTAGKTQSSTTKRSSPRFSLHALLASIRSVAPRNIHPHFRKKPSVNSQLLASQGSAHTKTPFISFSGSPSSLSLIMTLEASHSIPSISQGPPPPPHISPTMSINTSWSSTAEPARIRLSRTTGCGKMSIQGRWGVESCSVVGRRAGGMRLSGGGTAGAVEAEGKKVEVRCRREMLVRRARRTLNWTRVSR